MLTSYRYPKFYNNTSGDNTNISIFGPVIRYYSPYPLNQARKNRYPNQVLLSLENWKIDWLSPSWNLESFTLLKGDILKTRYLQQVIIIIVIIIIIILTTPIPYWMTINVILNWFIYIFLFFSSLLFFSFPLSLYVYPIDYWYSVTHSPEFDEFLSVLGRKVPIFPTDDDNEVATTTTAFANSELLGKL